MAVARLAVILALVACASASASAPAPAPEGGGGGEVPVAPTCSTVYDVAPEQRCRFVRDECAGGGDAVVNYLAIRFCVFEGDSVGSAVGATLVIACFILFYFYLLGDTSSEYFCPALEDVSYLLRWTPTLVGVTLLPLGNGAPVRFSSSFCAHLFDIACARIGQCVRHMSASDFTGPSRTRVKRCSRPGVPPDDRTCSRPSRASANPPTMTAAAAAR